MSTEYESMSEWISNSKHMWIKTLGAVGVNNDELFALISLYFSLCVFNGMQLLTPNTGPAVFSRWNQGTGSTPTLIPG